MEPVRDDGPARHAGAGPGDGAGSAGGTTDCSCSEARAHLEAFLDRECSQDVSQRLAQHVATCDRCSRLADAETHLRAILRSRCAEEAPPELRARVLGRLSMIRATGTVSGSVRVTSVVTGGAASSGGGQVAARTVETVETRSVGPAGGVAADGSAPAAWGYHVSRATWVEGG